MGYKVMSADAAIRRATIGKSSLIAASGFTQVGVPTAVIRALANLIAELGIQVRLISGASAGAFHDLLAKVNGIEWAAPFMNNPVLRKQINTGAAGFVDMHLSQVGGMLQSGLLGKLDLAIIQATYITDDGKVGLTTSSGLAPLFLDRAEQVIIEINQTVPRCVSEMHDVHLRKRPASPICLSGPLDRIGKRYAYVDREKVLAVVYSSEPDTVAPSEPPDERAEKIAEHIVKFLLEEQRRGRIPRENLVFQAGVGKHADAVMAAIAAHPKIPPFWMYTETLQNNTVKAMAMGRVLGVSTTALMLSQEMLDLVCGLAGDRIVIRPQFYTNAAEVIASLGVITINTAMEVGLDGTVNSTHDRNKIQNGIGGSRDFIYNALLSFVIVPSTAKDRRISAIVPTCSHVDHTDHDIMAVASEHGLVDTRCLTPERRSWALCQLADPIYRPYLEDYLRGCPPGHVLVDYTRRDEMHAFYQKHGTMLPLVTSI